MEGFQPEHHILSGARSFEDKEGRHRELTNYEEDSISDLSRGTG
jgi:hypothetical protein